MSGELSNQIGSADSLAPLEAGLADLDIDIQQGSSDFPDLTAQVEDTDGIQQFGVRFEDAVKHMSVNKYESVASMIREYVANMAATCLDADEQLGDSYTPTIHIAYYPDSETLIMEDNGMGMSDAEISNIGVQLGVSTNRYTKDRGGKYGIGLLSGLVGVGLDGAFYMHSRSRRTDEYVRGYWCSTGFKAEESLPDKLEDGQYGTRFEFPLTDPEVDIAGAVAEIGRWSRVPVLYSEHASDGSLIVDDEYGGRSETPFVDGPVDEDAAVVVEKEGVFRAVHDLGADDECVLLDVPIERNFDTSLLNDGDDKLRLRLPYRDSFDVVFHSEDEEIVAGPHEGLTRVSDGEYAKIPEEHRDGYLPASECAPADVWTPSPAGDRDRFEENPRFWRWLAKQFIATFERDLSESVAAIADADRVIDAPQSAVDHVVSYVEAQSFGTTEWSSMTIRGHLDTFDLTLPEGHASALAALSQTVDKCARDGDPWKRSNRGEVRIYQLLTDLPDDAEVWASARPSEKKARAVWDDHPGNVVVCVGGNRLETVLEQFGWNKLSDIDRDRLDDFDLSEETRELWERDYNYSNPNAGKEAPNRTLSLHRAQLTDDNDRGYKDQTCKESARYLRAYFEARECGYTPDRGILDRQIDLLILFPSNSDESITEYVGALGHGNVRLATCAVKTYEYLSDLEQVTRIEEYLDASRQRQFDTSAGRCSIPEAREHGETVVVHLAPDDAVPHLRDERAMQRAAEWFEQEPETVSSYRGRDALDDVVYVPASEATVSRVLPVFRHDDVRLATHETEFDLPEPTLITEPSYDTELYVYARLPEWEETAEFQMLRTQRQNLRSGMLGVIDGLSQLHDEGLPAPSQQATVDGETYRDMLEVFE